MTVLSVGNTPLLKIKELCTHFNLSNLFFKDESKNPFGTIKDRRSECIVKEAVKNNVNNLVLITASNAGYSLGKFCEGIGISVVNVIDKNTSSVIKKALKSCSEVREVDLSKKISSAELIKLARTFPKELIWDVCTGFLDAYDSLFNELKAVNPTLIILPVGSGNTFVSVKCSGSHR